MRIRKATVRLAMTAPLVVGVLAADARAQSLVIRGGTLIDGTGKPPSANTQIVIRDGVIADVTSGTIADAEVIDASDKFIVPGFIDSHIHYRDWETELFLAFGITSVNDLGNPYYWQTALVRGLNGGRMRGPRFFFGGEILLPDDAARNQPSIEEEFATRSGDLPVAARVWFWWQTMRCLAAPPPVRPTPLPAGSSQGN